VVGGTVVEVTVVGGKVTSTGPFCTTGLATVFRLATTLLVLLVFREIVVDFLAADASRPLNKVSILTVTVTAVRAAAIRDERVFMVLPESPEQADAHHSCGLYNGMQVPCTLVFTSKTYGISGIKILDSGKQRARLSAGSFHDFNETSLQGLCTFKRGGSTSSRPFRPLGQRIPSLAYQR
jgi:hypothetical protein